MPFSMLPSWHVANSRGDITMDAPRPTIASSLLWMSPYLSRQFNTSPSPYGAGFVMVFASSVTAPIRANARPSSVAPVFSVID